MSIPGNNLHPPGSTNRERGNSPTYSDRVKSKKQKEKEANINNNDEKVDTNDWIVSV